MPAARVRERHSLKLFATTLGSGCASRLPEKLVAGIRCGFFGLSTSVPYRRSNGLGSASLRLFFPLLEM
jgi:hypothetical protein